MDLDFVNRHFFCHIEAISPLHLLIIRRLIKIKGKTYICAFYLKKILMSAVCMIKMTCGGVDECHDDALQARGSKTCFLDTCMIIYHGLLMLMQLVGTT